MQIDSKSASIYLCVDTMKRLDDIIKRVKENDEIKCVTGIRSAIINILTCANFDLNNLNCEILGKHHETR